MREPPCERPCSPATQPRHHSLEAPAAADSGPQSPAAARWRRRGAAGGPLHSVISRLGSMFANLLLCVGLTTPLLAPPRSTQPRCPAAVLGPRRAASPGKGQSPSKPAAPPPPLIEPPPRGTLREGSVVEVWHANSLHVGTFRGRAPSPSRALLVELAAPPPPAASSAGGGGGNDGRDGAIKIDAGQLVGVWPEPPASLPSSPSEWAAVHDSAAALLADLPPPALDLRPALPRCLRACSFLCSPAARRPARAPLTPPPSPPHPFSSPQQAPPQCAAFFSAPTPPPLSLRATGRSGRGCSRSRPSGAP